MRSFGSKNETIGNTLIRSVKDGEIEIVKAFLTIGADLNICDQNGEPLLFDACKNLGMLNLFLSHLNTNVNILHGR